MSCEDSVEQGIMVVEWCLPPTVGDEDTPQDVSIDPFTSTRATAREAYV
jgi:hypothetical protein